MNYCLSCNQTPVLRVFVLYEASHRPLVDRASCLVLRGAVEMFVMQLLQRANQCAGHAKRSTLQDMDVTLATGTPSWLGRWGSVNHWNFYKPVWIPHDDVLPGIGIHHGQ